MGSPTSAGDQVPGALAAHRREQQTRQVGDHEQQRAPLDRRTERYRALVLVLAFGGLRFGEVTALRRSDVPGNGRLRVERSERRVGGRWVVGERRPTPDIAS